MSKKRKIEPDSSTKPKDVCILHRNDIQHGDFISLSKCKISPAEKLVQLQAIRDKRMLQPEDSPCRMANVCKQIADTLESLDLEITGYHKKCYKNSSITKRD